MGPLLAILLLLVIIPATVAAVVYRKQKNEGNSPVVWAIFSFIITAAVLAVAGFLLFAYAFGFER